MESMHTRRECLILVPAALAAAGLVPRAVGSGLQPASQAQAGGEQAAAPDWLPAQEPALVYATVGSSHGNLDRVKGLLKDLPQLANATVDWGFGDWETALGAASHTGRREIAELLMAHGARPDIFTFAMLGKLDAVKALVKAMPGIQRTRGPHAITLLAHARAGGADAQPVLDYLLELGDADLVIPSESIPGELREAAPGVYAFGERPVDRFHVSEKNGTLWIRREGKDPRGLTYRGTSGFSPAGAPDVRVRFEVEGEKASRLLITGPREIVRAQRIAD